MEMIYSIIFSLPTLVAFFWAILLFLNKKENTKSQNIWTCCLVVMGVCCLVWSELFYGIDDYRLYYKLDVVDIIFSLLIFPLVYLYFRSLTNNRKFTWKQYIWFVPAVVIGGMSATLYLLMGEEQAADFIRKTIESYESHQFEPGSLQAILSFVAIDLFYPLVFAQTIIVIVYSTLNVIRYRRGLENFFSNLSEKSIENNRAVLGGLYVLLFLALLTFFSRFIFAEKYFSIKYFFMAVAGTTIYYMSYHVYKIRFSAGDTLCEEQDSETPVNLENQDDVYKKILPQFIKLIDEDKIYLQPNLTLDDIARRLYSNRSYISHIINENFGCNFYEFISRKRVEYAKELILRTPTFSQEEIARESGFTHQSTFSRTFKQQTGMTFREWNKRVKGER